MFAKLIPSAVAILAAALFAYLGRTTILAYGAARYQAGLADARDRIIAAEARRAGETARLTELIERSQDEVRAYETKDAGRADCLGAERVRAIETGRAALFPAPAPAAASAGESGSVPADAARDRGGRQPGQRAS